MTLQAIILTITGALNFLGIIGLFIKFRVDIAKHKVFVNMKIVEIQKDARQHERMNEIQFEKYHKDVVKFKDDVKDDVNKLHQKIDSNNKEVVNILLNMKN